MKILFLDIETVPTEEALAEILSKDSQHEADDHTAIKRLSLSALTARILCIGYSIDPPHEAPADILHGDETEILRNFWRLATDVSLFVGHNILDFDLRFIYQRSIINQIKPSREIPHSRFRSSPVFDTMHEWSKWGRDFIKLDVLAKSLNIPSPKEDLDGSKVFEYYQAGNLSDIYEYCKRDVETVKLIYMRMTFSSISDKFSS